MCSSVLGVTIHGGVVRGRWKRGTAKRGPD